VGIEHPYETDGVQYLFDGDYGSYASPVSDGLAVLFTTAEPETLRFPWLVLNAASFDDSKMGNSDGVPDPGEVVSLVVELRNDGPVAATALGLRLVESAAGITVLDADGTIGDLDPGSTGSNADDPFAFEVEEGIQDSLVTLWVRPAAGANTRQGAIRLDLHLEQHTNPGTQVLDLRPCYPNPFGDGTSMSFSLAEDGRAVVRVYDVAGRLVRVVDDSYREAGPHVVPWDGTNRDGDIVASGVYFVRLEAGGGSRTRKVVLLR
jgi:hypothetical protein